MSIIGNAAPAFSSKAAKNGEIVDISLDDYKGKWLCLFFYPLDFTFVCPTEQFTARPLLPHRKNIRALPCRNCARRGGREASPRCVCVGA